MGFELELRTGLAATVIDGELRRAGRADNMVQRIRAFYLDELRESGKYCELGYSGLAQYAEQRLGMDSRRARELCRAGRVLMERPVIEKAFLEGCLSWTKVELLTHGVREHQQDEWVARAQQVTCSELRSLLKRHRKGLSTTAGKGPKGGLPGTEMDVAGTIGAAGVGKFEKVRDDLMRRRGALVDDSEVINYILSEHRLVERDEEREAELAADCEQKETPDWLRRAVLARDGHSCVACGGMDRLHVHHIVFRRHGGLTREDNLTVVCNRCHALIHEGRLHVRVSEALGVEIRNRFSELIRPREAGVPGRDLPGPVLRVIRGDGDVESPVVGSPVVGGGAGAKELPMDFDHSMIPDSEMGAWVKARLHLYDIGADGGFRVKKSVLRAAGGL